MSQGTPSLVIVGAFVAGAALGWFGRAWWDGSTVDAADATKQAQATVNASVRSASRIEQAGKRAAESGRTARKAIEVQHVDEACPPGLGAVSASAADRLRSEFADATSYPP